MSGDFEPWNNDPAVNEAPKPEKTPYTDDPRKASRVAVWIDVAIGFLVLAGVIWYIFYRK